MQSPNLSALEPYVYRDAAGNELPYRLLRPLASSTGSALPLVVFLHGAGERGADNERQLRHGIPQFAARANREKFPCFLIAPQCPLNQRWVEVDWSADRHTQPTEIGDAGRLTIELIEASLKELTIDPQRVYITGLSMGGFGAWDLIARRPDLFAAAAPVCGGGDEATAEKIRHIPIWAFHGARDTAVMPTRSRNMIAAVECVGGTPRYTEYPDVGHYSWDEVYRDPALFDWLFKQRKEF